MARQATVKAQAQTGTNARGKIESAGRKADEIVSLLLSNGYQVEVKKLVPGSEAPEATLELAITYSVEKSLFEAAISHQRSATGRKLTAES